VTRRIMMGFAISLIMAFGVTSAQDDDSRETFRSLDQDVQDLKKEVLDLNRDLFRLEEELLFPANSQVAFFISLSHIVSP